MLKWQRMKTSQQDELHPLLNLFLTTSFKVRESLDFLLRVNFI